VRRSVFPLLSVWFEKFEPEKTKESGDQESRIAIFEPLISALADKGEIRDENRHCKPMPPRSPALKNVPPLKSSGQTRNAEADSDKTRATMPTGLPDIVRLYNADSVRFASLQSVGADDDAQYLQEKIMNEKGNRFAQENVWSLYDRRSFTSSAGVNGIAKARSCRQSSREGPIAASNHISAPPIKYGTSISTKKRLQTKSSACQIKYG